MARDLPRRHVRGERSEIHIRLRRLALPAAARPARLCFLAELLLHLLQHLRDDLAESPQADACVRVRRRHAATESLNRVP